MDISSPQIVPPDPNGPLLVRHWGELRSLLPAILLFLTGTCLVLLSVRREFGLWFDLAIGANGVCAWVGGIAIVREGSKRKRFVRWLISNRDEIGTVGAEYEGQVVTRTTEVREYCTVISPVLMSWRISSRYYLPGQSPRTVACVFTFVSLNSGWWGYPTGPLFTIQSLLCNLGGGHRSRIHDVYAALDAEGARQAEARRLRDRPFLSTELEPVYKVAIAVIIIGLIALIYAFLTGQLKV